MLKYLASPYTDLSLEVMSERAKEACRIAYALLERGHMVIAPIAFCHQLTFCGASVNHEYWDEFDTHLILACDAIWIAKMEGWLESRGIASEIRKGRRYGRPLMTVDPFTLEIEPLHDLRTS